MKYSYIVTGWLLLVVICAAAGQRANAPQGVTAREQTLASGNNRFALDLYAKLSGRQGNLFFSPYGISSVLAMTSAGARGKTAEEIVGTLHFSLAPADVHGAFGELMRTLRLHNPSKGDELRIANALWIQRGAPLLPEFSKLVTTNYDASSQEVDFSGAREAARQAINEWVDKQTAGKITQIIDSNTLDARTRLVLTNAMYFKGFWASPFKKVQTQTAPFFSDNRQSDVPMMHQTGRFKFLDGDVVQALELPYSTDDLTMVILLPKQRGGLANLEASMTESKLSTWLSAAKEQDVEVFVPKWKFSFGSPLKQLLTNMGMKSAFIPGMADLSGINGDKMLYLSEVVHRAFVDVDETGTEAAAASGAIVKSLSLQVTPVFRADHPFVFLIRHAPTRAILFLGRVFQPMT